MEPDDAENSPKQPGAPDDIAAAAAAMFTIPQRVWLLERGHEEMRREFATFESNVMQRFEALDERGRSNSRWAVGILLSILLVVVPLLLTVLGQT